MKYYADDFKDTQTEVNGKWVTAKPFEYFTWDRFKRAWDIITGKAIAVYFHEDDIKAR